MLILEGSPYKSVVVEDLLNSKSNSLVFIYGDIGSFYIRSQCLWVSEDCPIEVCIEQIKTRSKNNYLPPYDYVIFYTNFQRKEIEPMVKALKDIDGKYCSCLIITCKGDLS